MDLGVFRGIITGVLLVLFIALVCWAWSRKRTATFDALARMPLEDEEPLP